MSDEVSKLLKSDLIRRGLTQEDFATKLGMTQQAVSAWYKRNTVPSRRIADIEAILGPDSQLVDYLQQIPQQHYITDTVREARRTLPTPKYFTTEAKSDKLETLFKKDFNVFVSHAKHDHSIKDALQSELYRLNESRFKYDEEERRFGELITQELPESRLNAEVHLGPTVKRYDYLSDNLCIDLHLLLPLGGRVMFNTSRISTKLIPLLLLQRATAETHSGRHYAIFVVTDQAKFSESRQFKQAEWECEQFNVGLHVVANVEEAADLIIAVESDDGSDTGV